MKYIKRDKFSEIIKWLDRREILAVKGPRQSGKTTLLEMLENYIIKEKGVSKQKVFYITFEDIEERQKFKNQPLEYISRFTGGKDERFYFLIDEFQYLPDGGQKLKLIYDKYKKIKFIITGSSSLELTQHTSKFLVGRIFSFELFPLSFGEYLQTAPVNILNNYSEKAEDIRKFIKSDITFSYREDIYQKDMRKFFEEYLKFGGYPEVAKSRDFETRVMILKNIYNTYLTKDIIELMKESNADIFRDLVRHIAVNAGDTLNYTALASDINSYFKEVKSYISILNETYIIKLLKPYHRNLTTELKKNPKIYFLDNGIRNYIVNNFNNVFLRRDFGKLVESAVLAALLREFNRESYQENTVKYWRTKAGAEVDFIFSGPKGLFPVEVKYSKSSPVKLSRGFKSFLEVYKPSKALVLTGGYINFEKINGTLTAFCPVWYFC